MKRLLAVLTLLFVPALALADTEKVEAGSVFAQGKDKPAIRIFEKPDAASKVLVTPPNGTRLVYRKTMVGPDGKTTWYFVTPPGRPAGWVAAADAATTRPGAPGPAKMIQPVDSGLAAARPTAAQTAAARGLSDSAKKYAENKQDLKLTVDQFLTLEKTVETYFEDPHHPMDGSYEDVTVPGRKKRAEEFKAGLK